MDYQKQLLTFGCEILEMQKLLDELMVRKIRVFEERGKIKEKISIHVNDAIDNATGKPLYSNETRRNLAISEALEKNDHYNAIAFELQDIDRQISDLNARLEFKRHMRRAYEIAFQYEANRCNPLNAA